MVSSKVAFVASLLLASLVAQAYSTACFKCSEMFDGTDCRNNTQQIKFLNQCDNQHIPDGSPGMGLYDITKKDFKCLTVEIKSSSKSVIERACVADFVTCDLLKTLRRYQNEGIVVNGTLESCSICDGDKCNSSSKAGIAIFTLIASLVSYVIFN